MLKTNMTKPAHKPLKIPGRRTVITKSMVETAIANTKSQSEAARWIGVSYNTYKKWAKYYKLWEGHLNPQGKGIKKVSANWSVPLDKILSGELEYKLPYKTFRKRLIDEGYKQNECEQCGYAEVHLTLGIVPLLVEFTDGNEHNCTFDNLRLLCPNCFLSFNGFLPNSRKFC